MTNYRDSTPINPETKDYSDSDVPSQIRNYSKQVREKTYGVDVRESIARAVDVSGIIAENAKKEAGEISSKQTTLEMRFDSVQNDVTTDSEVIDARFSAAGEEFETLKRRLDSDNALASAKSEIIFNLNDSIAMSMQDIALLTSLVVNEKKTVCFLNVSSSSDSASYKLEEIKKIAENVEINALVIANMGPGERFESEEIGVIEID
ncbi:hypothetical protein LISE100100_00380 [Listeria seeligeri]|uniref:hypothetical protein n=1 Tax=Listeria seeligeri TaxID=1640 RepID=UPI0001C4EC48|nr:hypothetical protein [Listeria seeligeri]CBH27748.1 hypothetical protein lse_1597 [Listeria seeligeri serovar 1/2b str. SLCC3954]